MRPTPKGARPSSSRCRNATRVLDIDSRMITVYPTSSSLSRIFGIRVVDQYNGYQFVRRTNCQRIRTYHTSSIDLEHRDSPERRRSFPPNSISIIAWASCSHLGHKVDEFQKTSARPYRNECQEVFALIDRISSPCPIAKILISAGSSEPFSNFIPSSSECESRITDLFLETPLSAGWFRTDPKIDSLQFDSKENAKEEKDAWELYNHMHGRRGDPHASKVSSLNEDSWSGCKNSLVKRIPICCVFNLGYIYSRVHIAW